MTSLLRKALANPFGAARVVIELAKGRFYKLYYPLTGRHFRAGRRLRVSGRLVIRGPGRVVFGDDVIVGDRTTPWTHHRDAVITVGSRTFLNGTRFGCARSITIGAECILADVRIMDTDFHSLHPRRHDPAAPVRVAPVRIEDNVWIAAGSGVLPGTTVGRNSVIGYGSVCRGSLPANMLIAGNPAVAVRALPDTAAD